MLTINVREKRDVRTDANGTMHSIDYIEGHCLPSDIDSMPTEDVHNGSTFIIMDGTGSVLTPRIAMFDAGSGVWKITEGS